MEIPIPGKTALFEKGPDENDISVLCFVIHEHCWIMIKSGKNIMSFIIMATWIYLGPLFTKKTPSYLYTDSQYKDRPKFMNSEADLTTVRRPFLKEAFF